MEGKKLATFFTRHSENHFSCVYFEKKGRKIRDVNTLQQAAGSQAEVRASVAGTATDVPLPSPCSSSCYEIVVVETFLQDFMAVFPWAIKKSNA